jgi:SecD/SecF fusion protein
MLENPSRQIALVLVFIIASVASFFTKELNWGNDLAGGTELIYEIDRKKAKLKKGANWDEFMASIVTTIGKRIDPEGVLNAEVLRRGESGIYIGLPKVTEQEAREIEAKITRLGTLRMQICAYDDYEDKDGKNIFDLAKERDRLNAWIAKDGNKEKLIKNPMGIERYHATRTENGGPLLSTAHLRWIPRKIEGRILPNGDRDTLYDYSLKEQGSVLSKFVVTLFDPAERQKEAEKGKYLLEYIPVNFDEEGFTGKDLVADQVVPSSNPQTGAPVVLYQITSDRGRAVAYSELSAKNIGNQSAIILDGFIKSAPVYKSRIPGSGMIEGFTVPEAESLAEVLKRGSLLVKPDLQSERTVGPTLGAESIMRGTYSLVIGAGVVLLFILFYYRIAGIVATIGLLLNVGFVFGAVSFIGATLTLPGLGGLVLTVGMAVDANILIYERIREEIKSGKDLLQSVRHGFERAMVTILDANVTTFIAGLVLYNFGVGPIRGFAVTLMIGILTSLFTAFFVSRLMFHYLLERKMERLPMHDWFSGLRFNFLKLSRPALGLSTVVILGGLAVFFTTEPNTKYALDFTGGADIRIVTKESMTPADLQARLTKPDSPFVKLLGNVVPQINTVKDDEGGKLFKYSVKIKVSPKLGERIKREKAAADEKGEVYRPPYVAAVSATLADILVPQAFTNPNITDKGDGRSNFADIIVHYKDAVDVAEIKKVLTEALGDSTAEIEVSGFVNGKKDATATKATDLLLEFDVAKGIDDNEKLTTFTNDKLKSGGFKLSNPIPDVATLGGRMVGELKSAAIGAMFVAMFCIVMYIRVRFREYKYGLGAVAALLHDVLVALGLVVLFNRLGIVSCELSLSMIAAFLTIIGYSINDTIVIFDRVRENLRKQAKAGDTGRSFADTINLSINQTLGRTILTSFTTLFVVGALFAVNYGAGSELEGFAFAMIIGVFTGTYSTIFVASPVVMWLRSREKDDGGLSEDGGLGELAPIDDSAEQVPVTT